MGHLSWADRVLACVKRTGGGTVEQIVEAWFHRGEATVENVRPVLDELVQRGVVVQHGDVFVPQGVG